MLLCILATTTSNLIAQYEHSLFQLYLFKMYMFNIINVHTANAWCIYMNNNISVMSY